jgi:very-short-patch-repair endonuclease
MADVDDKSAARRRFGHHRELAGQEVVHLDQLREFGYSTAQVRRQVEHGLLVRLHHNVYAIGTPSISPRARLLAALLSVGPQSFLSHRTAAAVYGLRAINAHDIELTLAGTGGRRRPGMSLHRTRSEPHPDDVRTHGDLRVSSVPRMLVELAPRERPDELARLITVAVQKRFLALDRKDARERLEAALARHQRWPGMATLKGVLAAYRRTDSSTSELERAFDRLIAPHQEIPEPQRNIHLGHWEIDRFWPAHRLAVELDGRPYHVAAGAMEKDRIKDAALLKAGVTPLRFTDFRVEHDARGILSDLRHFLDIG